MFSFLRRMGLGSHLKVSFAGATDPGRERDHNEDAHAISAEHHTAVVADGMGGLERGELASQWIADAVIEAVSQGQDAANGILAAHRRIRAAAGADGERMGSTAVTLTVRGSDAIVQWIGDSRAYLWRDQTLKQITRDHSFVEDLMAAGAITPQEAERHPNRNVLSRAVGIHDSPDVKIDRLCLPLAVGDRLLLCTDGLHGYLAQSAIMECLRQHGADPQQLVQQLIQQTLTQTDASDNLTVVCAAVEK